MTNQHPTARRDYAREQFILGENFRIKGNIAQAREHWGNVKREDDAEVYANAQFHLGVSFNDEGNKAQAREHWGNIKREDGAQQYAKAQFNLGVSFREEGNTAQAREHWGNIKREDDKQEYAKAQVNLGVSFNKESIPTQARECWGNVKRGDDAKAYAFAQFNLGKSYYKQDVAQAREHFNNIKQNDNIDLYANSQFLLGLLDYQQSDIKNAQKHWGITHNSGDNYFSLRAMSVLELINNKAENEQEINTLLAIKNIHRTAQDYDKQIIEQIFTLFKDKTITKIAPFQALLDAVNSILDILRVKKTVDVKLPKDPQDSNKDEVFPVKEGDVAHYTRPQTAYKMLSELPDNPEPSHFRLSTLEFVNDPTEGDILFDFLAEKGLKPKVNHERQTFIACFSFNHDWLNQFRLYGKDDNKEASGVSLVVDSNFFEQNEGEYFSSIRILEQSKEADTKNSKQSNQEAKKPQTLPLLPLYRCIYLDKDTGFLKLACREEWTFHREHFLEKNESGLKGDKLIELIEVYQNYINGLEKKVLENLEKIKINLNKIVEANINLIADTEVDHLIKKQAIIEVIDYILLKLRYLIKHMAFQEEQECRIYRIADLDDDLIQVDFKNKWFYMNYRYMKPHIKRIYLATDAVQHKSFFIKALSQKNTNGKSSYESCVKISENPFRNPKHF